MSRMWMVAYDISNDRIRGQVRKILQDSGTRVQYSIFECSLRDSDQAALQKILVGLIDTTDSLRWYPLCAWCKERIIVQGQGNRSEFPDFYMV